MWVSVSEASLLGSSDSQSQEVAVQMSTGAVVVWSFYQDCNIYIRLLAGGSSSSQHWTFLDSWLPPEWVIQQRVSDLDQDGSHEVFYILISEVTCHPFCHKLLLTLTRDEWILGGQGSWAQGHVMGYTPDMYKLVCNADSLFFT